MQGVERLDPDSIRAVFAETLALPEFREAEPSLLMSWLGSAARWVAELLRPWLPALGEGGARWLYLAALALVVGGVTALAVRRLGRLRRRVRGPDTTDGEPPTRDARAWRRWAEARARDDRLREAATGLYQAVLLHLDSSGALRHGSWKTAGDYLVEVSEDSELRGPLRTFLSGFVELAFGSREPTPDAFRRLLRSADRLGCPS